LLVFALALAAGGLVLLAAWSAWRPLDALVLLLALLVFHSGAVLVLQNMAGLDSRLVTALSAWKEAVLVGLAVAAFLRLRQTGIRAQLSPAVLTVLFLLLVGFRIALDVVARVSISEELFAARNACEFAVLFVIVAILAPDTAWLRRASWVLVPLVMLSAEAAFVQLLYGFRLDHILYQNPGEQLASAFSAKFGGQIIPRAVGTYVAPNEFGLGLTIYLLAVIFPLALLRPDRRLRIMLGIAALACLLALVLTYSRSAWGGLFVAALFVGVLLRRQIWARIGGSRETGAGIGRRGLAVGLAAAALLAAVFVVSGGSRFLTATLLGQEASAAARPSSLEEGVQVVIQHPLGLGVAGAGPKALSVNKGAVLTENWYLVYGIQVGWAALAALLAILLGSLAMLTTRIRAGLKEMRAFTEPLAFQIGACGALVAALTGALFIPALLDLPASLTLWTFVAVALAPDRAVASRAMAANAAVARASVATA
jgi:hypothetical protein